MEKDSKGNFTIRLYDWRHDEVFERQQKESAKRIREQIWKDGNWWDYLPWK